MEVKIKLTKSLPGFGLIAIFVAIAFEINKLQPAISPLAVCVLFGFLAANLFRWPDWADAGTTETVTAGLVSVRTQYRVTVTEADGNTCSSQPSSSVTFAPQPNRLNQT